MTEKDNAIAQCEEEIARMRKWVEKLEADEPASDEDRHARDRVLRTYLDAIGRFEALKEDIEEGRQ